MKTKLVLKAISMLVMFGLVIGAFLSLTPSSVSALSANSSTNAWPPTPAIKAYLSENWVEASFWPLGSVLTLTISDDSGEAYTTQAAALPDPWGFAGFTFKLGAAFNLQPGQTVTISDGSTTKVLKVMDLYVDSFKPAKKTITGHSDPFARVRLDIWLQGVDYLEVTANEMGTWKAKFDASYAPFSPFTDGTIGSTDEDGDTTQFRINMGIMSASPDNIGLDNIFYVACTLPRTYTLTIDDSSNGTGIDYETTQLCVMAEIGQYTYLNFMLDGFDLDAGDLVTVASKDDVRTLTVAPRGTISFDTIHDTISGINGHNTYLTVTTPGASRTIKTGPDGKWSIDYSLPGSKGEPAEQIVRGMRGSIQEYNAVGDSTSYNWSVPAPFLEVRPQYDLVFAFGWDQGVELKLSVESLPGKHLADLTAIVGDAPAPGPNVAVGDFSAIGFDLQPGQVLTVSGGGITFAYLIPDPKITNFDVVADTISGTGTPGAQVVVTAKAPGQRFSRWVTADEAGSWMASFGPSSNPNDSPGSFDLQPGSQGVVLEINEYWDKTWGNDWIIP